MFVDVLLGTLGVVGMATGAFALVFYRHNGNGHAPEPAPQPVTDWQSAKMREALQPLAILPQQLDVHFEGFLARLAELHARAPETPAWSERMREELDAFSREQAQAFERITDRLEMLLQMGPPAPVDLTPVVKSLEILGKPPAETPQIQLPSEFQKRLDNLIAHISRLMQPTIRTEPPQPKFTPRGPITRAPGPVHLDMFNTIPLQDNELTELVPPEQGIYVASVFNLGAGTVFMKAKDDLYIDDPLATTIPAGSGDNGIPCPRSLFVIAEDGSKISVRLNH